jgi:hypothetical protein
MSDFDAGAAPAAAESISAPVATPEIEQVVDTPNPISTHSEPKPKEEPKAPEEKKPLTPRESLQKAAAKVKAEAAEAEAKGKEAGAEKKPEDPKGSDPKGIKTEPAKAPDKPAEKATKEATEQKDKPEPVATQPKPTQAPEEQPKPVSKHAAPDRFSPDAKTAWEAAPEPVKAEVHRAIRELEQGHQKYKADAEAFSEVREYHELAKQHGTSIKDALTRYTGLEQRLASSDSNVKAQAVAEVLQYAGITPHQYAAYVSGQSPDQVQSQNDQTINSLRQELSDLKKQIGGVTSTIQEQRSSAVMNDIAKFAESHPRFDELGETIAELISKGMTDDLQKAYDMAERLNPAPVVQQKAPEPVVVPVPDIKTDDLKAQTLKGSKSVAGAPTPGSNPGGQGKPSSSIREALKRAQAASG